MSVFSVVYPCPCFSVWKIRTFVRAFGHFFRPCFSVAKSSVRVRSFGRQFLSTFYRNIFGGATTKFLFKKVYFYIT